MTRYSFVKPTANAVPILLFDKAGLQEWAKKQSETLRQWIASAGFEAKPGAVLMCPAPDGKLDAVLVGRNRDQRFSFGSVRIALPEGTYRLATELLQAEREEAALGWLLAGYSFSRYKNGEGPKAQLVVPDNVDAAQLEALAAGEVLTRDLINTPASDMGPAELAKAAADLARSFGSSTTTITGEKLLDQNFPMIHAVGRASDRRPRLIDFRWGTSGPRVTLVGKGVCFDTGGLNLKPAGSMGLMKKDMGGAATVLGLAHMIMATGMKLRLRVLIPAVENSVSGASFRPQDVLTSRKGLTVEINNTDAEGRLVLADALALADEEKTDLIISMATLTGAARVAVGPDIAPFFTDDDDLASALAESGAKRRDPVWRLPFHAPYERMIEPKVADLDNAPKGGFAGSITAALFLRRFVTESPRYLHFDIYGWQPSAAPSRPVGGVGQGARAVLDALPKVLNL